MSPKGPKCRFRCLIGPSVGPSVVVVRLYVSIRVCVCGRFERIGGLGGKKKKDKENLRIDREKIRCVYVQILIDNNNLTPVCLKSQLLKGGK